MLFKSLSLLFCVLSRSNVPVFLTTQRRSLRPTTWTMVRPTSESFPVVMVGWGLAFSGSGSIGGHKRGEHRTHSLGEVQFLLKQPTTGLWPCSVVFPSLASQVTSAPP